MTTVSAPLPEGTRLVVSAEPTFVLRKRVAAFGSCSPTSKVVATHLSKLATEDPWFPVEEVGSRANFIAAQACKGCPVMTDCLALAYREELEHGDVYGVRGGKSPGFRRDAIAAHNKALEAAASTQDGAQ